MHHVIFIPGESDATNAAELLASVGLAGDSDGATAFVCPDALLPTDQQAGQLVIWAAGQNIPAAIELDWTPAVAHDEHPRDRYFVGTCREHPPKPLEVLREQPIAGDPVLLGDGQRWMLPTVQTSPQTLYARDGQGWGLTIPPRLAPLWHALADFRAVINQTDDGIFEEGTACDLATLALNVNYRLPRELIGKLGLLTSGLSGTLQAILKQLLFRATDSSPVLN